MVFRAVDSVLIMISLHAVKGAVFNRYGRDRKMHCAWLQKLVAEAIGVVASDPTGNSFRLLTTA